MRRLGLLLRLTFLFIVCTASVLAVAKPEKFPTKEVIAFINAAPRPQYPPLALAMRISGRTVVRVCFDPTGKITRTETTKSSGSMILDLSTRAFIEDNWHFTPELAQSMLANSDLPPADAVSFPLAYVLPPHAGGVRYKVSAALPPAEKTLNLTMLSSPTYPGLAQRYKITGKVIVEVEFTDDSNRDDASLDAIAIVQSSGNDLLDLSTVEYAYEHWSLPKAALKMGSQARSKKDPQSSQKYRFNVPVTYVMGG